MLRILDCQNKWQAEGCQTRSINGDHVFQTKKQVCFRCFDFNNVGSKEGEGELGCLVFPKVAK